MGSNWLWDFSNGKNSREINMVFFFFFFFFLVSCFFRSALLV
jgi:hypothetical protein